MKTFNFSDRRLSKEQQEAFIHGYESMLLDVASMGTTGKRNRWNW